MRANPKSNLLFVIDCRRSFLVKSYQYSFYKRLSINEHDHVAYG
jgi:hypothetical protein